ncbi:MAG: hypothetical protein IT324_27860 [Anaerolineae bacterium]|nr:hypothetical protein [Anaerolineae bacterium]
MRRAWLGGALLILLLALAACDTSPVVVVATPVPLDASFTTYHHPSGVFRLRLPPDWSVRDISQGNTVRVEFSPPNNTGLPMSVYVINTGTPLDATTFLDAINRYQAAINGNASVYTEVSRNAMGDGSWRLVGVRQTPLGPRQLNTFLQADKAFLSAIEIDITGAADALLQTFRAIINTYRVDPTVVIGTNPISAPEGGAASAAGMLAFSGINTWASPQGVFIINGQITNQSGGPLEGIRVTAILYDAQNNALVEQSNVIGIEVLEDKAVAAFSVRFQNGRPSQAVRYELQAAARNAAYAIKTHLGNDSFLLGNDKAVYNAGGFLTVGGDVVNKTKGPAHFIKATVILYDDQQRVVGTDSAFLSKPDLLPGEAGHFEVTFYEVAGNAVRYVISIEGKTE